LRTLQTQWVKTVTMTADEMPGMVSWKSYEMPVLSLNMAFEEDVMREAFQASADLNLNAWSHAADFLSALPVWAHWPTQIPGRMMTDMFDRFKPRHTFTAANDEDAPPAQPKAAGPVLLDSPLGAADDLTLIKGIGAKISSALNDLGIYHFDQMTSWSKKDIEWINQKLGFAGRLSARAGLDRPRP
ncbi:MAG: hypothetical protein AAGJ50_11875, partial [Pseudomonadota bacterium]